MTYSIASPPTSPEAPESRGEQSHRGSAPFNLSGRSVLAAWFASITVHALVLVIIGNVVLPFASERNKAEPPVAKAEIIGHVDAPSLRPPPVSTTQPTLRLVERPPVHELPTGFSDLSELTRPTSRELSIAGMGTGNGDAESLNFAVDIGLSSEFFGVGRSARGAQRIVYVVDRSGSMLDSFAYVQSELKRSIAALRRSQKFHVIFFNSGPPLESPPQRLVSAIHAHKQQFFAFLDTVVPRGDTQPERAMRRALALEPDLIYLLSDGIDFEPTLLQKLDEWNKGRRTRIFTIAYLDRTGSELLERIARAHNGEFTFVSEYDLP